MDNLNLFDRTLDNSLNTRQQVSCNALLSTTQMTPMNTLDASEVRAGRCPICKGYRKLEHVQGFLVCPRCLTNYKVFANTVYIIDYIPDDLKALSINEIMLHNMGGKQRISRLIKK